MTDLPTGTVTLLFTDIESSSMLWDEDSDPMRASLSRHNDVFDDAVAAHGGHV